MRTQVLRRYIEPLLGEDLRHIQTLRIGTKALAFWPGRFLDDPDADDLLRLFERVVKSGRHLALMAHFSHPRELDAPAARAALARIQATGAVVRCQAPLVRHVNDSVETWTELWQKQVQLGAIPYYMFMERDTGPRDHFELPIARALAIFQGAYARVSGLARSVRGPVMSTTAGKVLVEGTATIAGEQAFVLKFTRPRAPEDGAQVFFAKLDPTATWFDQLRPLGDTTSSSSRTLATDEAAAPVIPTRSACTKPCAKQSSGVAAWRKRLSTMSIHMQKSAPANVKTVRMGGAPLTRLVTRRARRKPSPMVMTMPPITIATSASELPHAANQSETVPRSAKPRRTVSRPM